MSTVPVRRAVEWVDSTVGEGVDKLESVVGGSARLRVIVLLACVLGLDSADQGAIGAVAPYLEKSLHISNVELGLLITVTALVGAVATIPMGNYVDRKNRVRLLVGAIVLWAVAEAVSALSVDYTMLIVTRVALGAVTAVAAPAVASLIGDLFPANDRGRVYGFIVTGEVLGAGFGVLVAGLVAGWFGWRPAIGILALPSFALVYALVRHLPEPARGGHSWIVKDAEEIPATREAPHTDSPALSEDSSSENGRGEQSAAIADQVEREGVRPAEEIVVKEDPSEWSLRQAVRYVVRVRTNVVLIIAGSLGYFFYAGLKTFAVLFVRNHYHISQGFTVGLMIFVGAGAVVGLIFGGRHADRRISRRKVTARVDVGIVGYMVAAVVLAPAILTTNLWIAVPLIIIGAAGIAAPNGTLDAARLDVIPSHLWGRAEAVRTVLRTSLEAFAPLIFGVVSELFGSSKGGFGVVGGGGLHSSSASSAEVGGLGAAFLIMLIPLFCSGVMLIWARRTYPTDVASAGESQRRVAEQNGERSQDSVAA